MFSTLTLNYPYYSLDFVQFAIALPDPDSICRTDTFGVFDRINSMQYSAGYLRCKHRENQ